MRDRERGDHRPAHPALTRLGRERPNYRRPVAVTSRKIAHLGTVPLFAACSRRDFQRLASVADEVSLKAGRVLVEQGRRGHEFFLIIEGQAVVRRNGWEVAVLTQGQHFGELALLTKGPRDATVTADTNMVLLVIGQRDFLGVLDEVPVLSRKMLRYLATRLQDIESTI
jgi:CRP/FNR family cyclic AMP-dependent transcriptional regulator